MICNNCNYQNESNYNFCSQCGASLKYVIKNKQEVDYLSSLWKIAAFLFVQLIYILLLYFIPIDSNYENSLIQDLVFIVIVIFFAIIYFKNISSLFKFSNIKIKPIILITILTPIFTLLVKYFVDYLNIDLFNYGDFKYSLVFLDSPYPFLLSILSVAFVPAVFEEIAFRGIIFTEFSKIVSLKNSIILSAVVFTLIHLSLFSIIWMFPFSLFLGYFRAKYRTIWYSILIHFLHNSFVIIFEFIL